MSRKTTPRETKKPQKLTRTQKKEIDAVIRKCKGDGKRIRCCLYRAERRVRHDAFL